VAIAACRKHLSSWRNAKSISTSGSATTARSGFFRDYSGFFRDYQVAFPSDCNASFDDGMHQASLKTIDMFFGRVMTTE
jgi:nicotinamidase-related amidase